jgi:iron complex outermembrane recepter protein
MSYMSTRIRPAIAARENPGICRSSWLAGVVALASLYCGAALAQPADSAATSSQSNGQSLLAQTSSNPPAPADNSAPGPNQTSQLQEVVVTATFRAQNLQSTPLSITAITAADLQQQNLTNVNDIGAEIPNAYFRQPVSNFGPTETIGLRGFVQTDFDFSFQPTVGVYVDDVYQGSLTGSSFDLADLQRVEVENGPQGTLFGMNSIGGAIRLITNKPQDNNSGSIQLTYGEKHRVEVVGIGNAVLVPDKLFARVVATSRTQDSIGHTLDFTCEMKAQGQPTSVYGTLPQSVSTLQGTGCSLGGLGGYQHQGLRAELRYLPTSKLEVNVNAYYYRQYDEPPLQALLTPYGGPSDFGNDAYDAAVVFPKFGMNFTGNTHFVSPSPWDNYATDGDVVTGQQNDRMQKLDEYGTSATVDYQIADNLQLKYIWSYRTYTTNWSADSDLTPFALTQDVYLQGHRQFTDELRLTGNLFDHRLEYTVGGFYYDARQLENSASQFDAYNFLGILPNFENVQGFSTNNESGYVHLVYHFTDKWSVSAGWRLTSQYQTEKFAHYTGDPATSIILPGPVTQSGSRGLWSGSINYQMTPSVFLYAETANGFTLPGFNARVETIGQAEEPVPGQYAINYELGAKTDWFDHRLRVNGSVFYEDYKSYLNLELGTQCTPASSLNPGTPIFGLPFGGVCPAGTPLAGQPGLSPWFYYTGIPAYMPGAELEVYAEPIERLLVNLTGGWEEFHSKISDTTNPAYINPSVRLQPEWDASGGVQYGIMLPNSATLTPRLDWRYQGYQTNGPANTYQIEQWRTPGYSLFNASLVYQPSGANWNVAFRVENLFNKFYWEQLGAPTSLITTGLPPSAGNLQPAVAQVGTPGDPREWMVTFGMNF